MQVVTGFWVLATIAVFLIVGDGELPFGERPSLEGVLLAGQVMNGWANLGITYSLEARRKGFGTKLQKTPTGELPRTLESGSLTLENAVKRKFNIGEFTFYEVG